MCHTPALPSLPDDPWVRVEFVLDNLVFDFATLNPTPFSYEVDPTLRPLNPEDPTTPFRHKPGSVLSVEVLLPLGRGKTQGPSLCWTVLLCGGGERDGRAGAGGWTWLLAFWEGAGGGVPSLKHLIGAWVLTFHSEHLSDKTDDVADTVGAWHGTQ